MPGPSSNRIRGRNSPTSELDLWEMNGATVLARGVIGSLNPSGYVIAGVADFNGDGMADILFRLDPSGLMALWEMNGRTVTANGVFRQVSSPDWKIKGVADYNGDRQADIFFRHTSDLVAMWEMNGREVLDDRVFGQVVTGVWETQPTVEESGALGTAGPVRSLSLIGQPLPPAWWTPAINPISTWLPPLNPLAVTFAPLSGGAPILASRISAAILSVFRTGKTSSDTR